MKKIIISVLGFLTVFSIAWGATVFQVIQGGTGASTLTGCVTAHGTAPFTASGVCGGTASTTLYSDNGNFTGANQFATLLVTGSSTLQNFTGLNSTTTNATTTTFFSTIASSSKLFTANFSGANLSSCSGTNALTWVAGLFGCTAIPQGTVTSVTGTANRITSTGGATPQIDISGSYVGQASITTVGTLSSGAVPASLVTSGTFGSGSYTFQNDLTVTGNATTTDFFATLASTTNLYIGAGPCSGSSALNVVAGKVVCGAVSGVGSASSTLYADNGHFTGGNIFTASTTIGDGTGTGGLTISGNGTTTGKFEVGLGVGAIVGTNGQIVVNQNGAAGLILHNSTLGNEVGVFAGANGHGSVGATTNNQLRLLANNSPMIYIDPSGNNGIATATPKWALEIATGTRPQLAFSDSNPLDGQMTERLIGTTFYWATSSPVTFATSTVAAMSIDLNGQLTIPYNGGVTGCAQFNSSGALSNLGTACSNGASTTLLTDNNNFTGATTLNTTLHTGSTTLQNFTGLNSTTSNATSTTLFTTKASTTALYLSTSIGCLQVNSAGLVTSTGSNCSSGGGGGNSKFATSTGAYLGITPNGGLNVNVGIGTSTPVWPLTIATSSKPQFELSDGTLTNNLFGIRQVGNFTYFGTSSPSTFATSSNTALTIDNNGNFGISSTSPYARLSIDAGNTVASYFDISSNGTDVYNVAPSVGGGALGIGTTTTAYVPWALFVASSTKSQFTLSDTNPTNDMFSIRRVGNITYFATSSASTYATSTSNDLTIDTNGLLTFNALNTTTTNATTTNLFSTTASSTNLFFTTGNGGNLNSSGAITANSYKASGATAFFDGYTVSSDSNPTVHLSNAGPALNFGPGGSTALDVTIARQGTQELSIGQTGAIGTAIFTGFGTTTSKWAVEIATSTRSQLTLSDASLTDDQWSFRNAGGNLYFATSSPSTFATSTLSFLSLIEAGSAGGALGISTSSPVETFTVAGGGILNAEGKPATSTSQTVALASTTQTLIQMGGVSMTVTLTKPYAGQATRVMVCNPTGTAGALTWAITGAVLTWSGNTNTAPTQTTTANACDLYMFVTTQASSTAGALSVFGTQIANF